MNSPTEVTVGHKNMGSKNVSHEYFLVGARDRYRALKRLADANPEIFSVIFCRTKRDTQKVAEQLIEDGYSAGALHGDLSQNQRDVVMKSFRVKQIQMLVATDVAARGIDVDDITHVINYQLPDEIETYTHRSGRTGRAGKSGISMVIVSRSEVRKIKSIEKIIKKEFTKKGITFNTIWFIGKFQGVINPHTPIGSYLMWLLDLESKWCSKLKSFKIFIVFFEISAPIFVWVSEA